MAIDVDKVLKEIRTSGDDQNLQRLGQFLDTQRDSDEEVQLARSAIEKKRAEMQQAATTAAMTKQAVDYRNQLPGMKETAFSGVAGDARRGLSQQLAGVTQGAQSRGLLYSGLKQGAQQQAIGQTAGALAGARGQINQQYEDQARSRETAARTGNIQDMGTAVKNDADIYGQAMENVKARQGVGAAVGSAVGTVAGGLLGRKR